MTNTRRSCSFVVRLWCEPSGAWRASVIDAHSGARHHFADLDALVAFLRQAPQAQGTATTEAAQHITRGNS